ncbi:MAG TPA: hypothetical protein DCE81_01890 [Cytophagales bacterium]|nr:hypothetical protein [Cytophagales bacterium]
MSIFLYLLFNVFQGQQPVSTKPADEYDLKIQYEFRQRTNSSVNQVHVDETVGERDKRLNTSPLPYLVLNLNVIKLGPKEVRLKVVRGARDSFINRKVKEGDQIKVEIGFVDDLKDRTIEFEYEIIFLNEKKDAQSRIHLFVEKDGTFKINGEVRGKF